MTPEIYDTPFYINYVGCKQELSLVENSVSMCFILTMWDVNVYWTWDCGEESASFILTMWDVNLATAFLYSSLCLVLY